MSSPDLSSIYCSVFDRKHRHTVRKCLKKPWINANVKNNSFQEIARHLRPGTLRAMFGKDKIKNAVHCSDLPEDGLIEVCMLVCWFFGLQCSELLKTAFVH